jgi:hypothetical protein
VKRSRAQGGARPPRGLCPWEEDAARIPSAGRRPARVFPAVLPAMKSFLLVAVVAGAMAAPPAPSPPAPSPLPPPVQLTLPGPTGPYSVGTVPLHLVDPARHDPWDPSGAPRELMISLWYPARSTAGLRRAPWLPPAAAAQFARDNGLQPDAVKVPVTHGYTGAPVSHCGSRLPVVLAPAAPRPSAGPAVPALPGGALHSLTVRLGYPAAARIDGGTRRPGCSGWGPPRGGSPPGGSGALHPHPHGPVPPRQKPGLE